MPDFNIVNFRFLRIKCRALRRNIRLHCPHIEGLLVESLSLSFQRLDARGPLPVLERFVRTRVQVERSVTLTGLQCFACSNLLSNKVQSFLIRVNIGAEAGCFQAKLSRAFHESIRFRNQRG